MYVFISTQSLQLIIKSRVKSHRAAIYKLNPELLHAPEMAIQNFCSNVLSVLLCVPYNSAIPSP